MINPPKGPKTYLFLWKSCWRTHLKRSKKTTTNSPCCGWDPTKFAQVGLFGQMQIMQELYRQVIFKCHQNVRASVPKRECSAALDKLMISPRLISLFSPLKWRLKLGWDSDVDFEITPMAFFTNQLQPHFQRMLEISPLAKVSST